MANVESHAEVYKQVGYICNDTGSKGMASWEIWRTDGKNCVYKNLLLAKSKSIVLCEVLKSKGSYQIYLFLGLEASPATHQFIGTNSF